MADAGRPSSWNDVESLASRQEDWASQRVSKWEAFVGAAVRLVLTESQGGSVLLQALIRFCKVPVPPAALKRIEAEKAIPHLYRVPGLKVLGALGHLSPSPIPTALFLSVLSERYERTVSESELSQAIAEAARWTGWPPDPGASESPGQASKQMDKAPSHGGGSTAPQIGSEDEPAHGASNGTVHAVLNGVAGEPAPDSVKASDSTRGNAPVNRFVNAPVETSVSDSVGASNYEPVYEPERTHGDGTPQGTLSDSARATAGASPSIYPSGDAPDTAAKAESRTVRSTVSESADEEASASVGGFNDGLGFVHGAAPVVAPTHETTAASPYVSSLPSSGNPVGRPRSVKQDADLGVAEVTARLDAGYTRAFVTAYFRAQAQVAEPSTQVTWRVTERPSWSYAPAHVALVAAIANTVGIPHKTPIGVMLLTTGLHLLTEALPPVGKVLKVTNGSLAHLGIPPVTRQGVVPSALVAEVRSQYQEEIGIATLPVAFRKQQSWSARGLRDNWSIPKALHGAIRTVARELRLEDSAVANLALRAGVHVLENRVDVFIVPVE